MGKAPAYQMYAQDFDMDTASWSNDEVGMYTRLLNYEWINGSIPSNLEDIARITREPYSPRFHQRFTVKWMRNVAAKFTPNHNGNLINKRMEEVRQSQFKYSESRRKNVSVRYKDKPTYEPTHEEHSPYIDPALQSSSSSSSLKNKDKRIKHIAKAKKMPSPDVKIFIDFYHDEFKKAFNTTPIIQSGKDATITKSLLKTISLEELQILLQKFFDSEDSFIQGSGYTIGVFNSQINKLRIGTQKHSGLKSWANEIQEEEDARKG